MRVLVVDDEQELVEALVERLTLRGVEAAGVTSGAEALERIDSETYDVVLLDVKMPGVGGLEVIKRIKERWPRLQVVLLTGHGSAESARRGMQLGAAEYLMKPLKLEELMATLRRAVGGAEGEGS